MVTELQTEQRELADYIRAGSTARTAVLRQLFR